MGHKNYKRISISNINCRLVSKNRPFRNLTPAIPNRYEHNLHRSRGDNVQEIFSVIGQVWQTGQRGARTTLAKPAFCAVNQVLLCQLPNNLLSPNLATKFESMSHRRSSNGVCKSFRLAVIYPQNLKIEGVKRYLTLTSLQFIDALHRDNVQTLRCRGERGRGKEKEGKGREEGKGRRERERRVGLTPHFHIPSAVLVRDALHRDTVQTLRCREFPNSGHLLYN